MKCVEKANEKFENFSDKAKKNWCRTRHTEEKLKFVLEFGVKGNKKLKPLIQG